jgi:hypothetical protein
VQKEGIEPGEGVHAGFLSIKLLIGLGFYRDEAVLPKIRDVQHASVAAPDRSGHERRRQCGITSRVLGDQNRSVGFDDDQCPAPR